MSLKFTGNMPHKAIIPAGGVLLDRYYVSLYCLAEHYCASLDGVLQPNTIQAQQADLKLFLRFYQAFNGHDDARQWLPRDSSAFLRALEEARSDDGLRPYYRPRSLNRILASVRRFARWIQSDSGTPFLHGLPTRGIKEYLVDELGFRGLTSLDMNRLLKAADKQVYTRITAKGELLKLARPWRDRAIVYLLRGCGLRETEVANLDLHQYQGKYLQNVKCKGRRIRAVFVPQEARSALNDYLSYERTPDDPNALRTPLLLLPARHGKSDACAGRISRALVYRAVKRVTVAANQHLPADQHIQASPHTLRHTKGHAIIQAGGHLGDVADALGHSSVTYAVLYARRPAEEREALLERS